MTGITITTQSAGFLGKAAPMPHYKEAPPEPPVSTPPPRRAHHRLSWPHLSGHHGHAPRTRAHGGRRHS